MMADKNTKRTASLLKVSGDILYIVGGGLIGFFGGRSLAGYFEQVSLIYLVATLILSVFFHLVIHETGHLLGGLVTGYQFSSFRIFDLALVWNEHGHFHWRWQHVAGTAGQCLMRPPRYQAEHFPFRLYLAGGVLANVLTSLILYWLWPNPYSVLFMLIGFALALMNALPITFTDGAQYRLLSRSELNRFIFYLQLEDVYWAYQGKSYDEKYRLLRQVTINETNLLTDATLFFDLDQLLDRLAFEEVYVLAKKIYEQRQDMIAPYRQQLLLLLYLSASLQHPDDPLIGVILKDPLLKGYLKQKKPEIALAQAAYQWRVEGQSDQAQVYLRQARQYLSRAHNLRDQEQVSRCIEYVETGIDADS